MAISWSCLSHTLSKKFFKLSVCPKRSSRLSYLSCSANLKCFLRATTSPHLEGLRQIALVAHILLTILTTRAWSPRRCLWALLRNSSKTWSPKQVLRHTKLRLYSMTTLIKIESILRSTMTQFKTSWTKRKTSFKTISRDSTRMRSQI